MSETQEWQQTTFEPTEGALCETCSYRAAIARISVHRETVNPDETREIEDTVFVLCDECIHELKHVTGLDIVSSDDEEASE